MVVEARNSRPDNTPYIDVVIENTEVASLTLVNESSQTIKSAVIEFDALGIGEIADEKLRELIDATRERALEYSVPVQSFKEYRKVSLLALLRSKFPDLTMYEFLAKRSVMMDRKGRVTITKLSSADDNLKQPPGFVQWYKQNEKEIIDDDDPPKFWIIGRITVTGENGDAATVDFGADLDLIMQGVGSGTIDYDLREFVDLPVDGRDHRYAIKIGQTLAQGKDTFRGLLVLRTPRSSFHQIRISLKSSKGEELMISPWADTHILVSQNDKRAIAAL
jgi:hypothetical protein